MFGSEENTTVSLRDYFAGLALAALIANPEKSYMKIEEMTKEAYEYADNMLYERDQ